MKKISSKKSLTRKVLCSVMAAGMMGIAGNAFAAEYSKTITPNDFKDDPMIVKDSYVQIDSDLDNVTVNVNTMCVSYPEDNDYEFIGAVADGNKVLNLGGTGKTVTINVDGSANKDADVIGVLADDKSTININGSTTINTFIGDGVYGSAIVGEDESKINVTGDTIKLSGHVEAYGGSEISLSGKDDKQATVNIDKHVMVQGYTFDGEKVNRSTLNINAKDATFKGKIRVRDTGIVKVDADNIVLNTRLNNTEAYDALMKVSEAEKGNYSGDSTDQNAAVVASSKDRANQNLRAEVHLNGNVDITAYRKADDKNRVVRAVYTNHGGRIWLGGEGKTVNINADASALGENSYAAGVNADGGHIRITGETINVSSNGQQYNAALATNNDGWITINGGEATFNAQVRSQGWEKWMEDGVEKEESSTITMNLKKANFNSRVRAQNKGIINVTADDINVKVTKNNDNVPDNFWVGATDREGIEDSYLYDAAVWARDVDSVTSLNGNVTIEATRKAGTANKTVKAVQAYEGTVNLGGEGKTVNINVDSSMFEDGIAVGVVADENGTVNITGTTTINCNEDEGAAVAIMSRNGGTVNLKGEATAIGNVFVENGSDLFAEKLNIDGFMEVTNDGAVEITKGGSFNARVDDEADALTVDGGTAILTNTVVNGGVVLRSGSLTMTGGAINGIARSEIHDGDFEKTEIDIQTGTAELTNTNINAVILVGMPGEDPDEYPTESSKLVLNATNDTTKYTPEYILVGPKGSVEIKGGTLEANNLKKMTSVFGETSRDGGIVLNGGTISTMSGQIFEKGIDTTSEESAIASTASGAVTNKVISFVSGTLQLNDSLYTTKYYDAAVSALNNNNVELVMMGTLVRGPVAIIVDNINEEVGAGTHDSVVLTAPEDSATSIVVTSDVVTSGVGSVDLANTSEKTFAVVGGKEFTLTGGATGAIVQGAESATVNVGEESKLNIGAQGKNVTLAGNLVAGAGSAVDVRSNLVVAGNVTLNNAQLSAAEAEVSVKDLAVNAGSAITSAKAITADKLSMVSGQISAQALTVGAITQAKDSTITVDNVEVTGDVAAENLSAKALKIGGNLVSSGKLNATDITVTGVAEVAGANVANLTAGSLNATGVVLATDKVNVTGAATVANLTAKEFTVGGTTTVKGDLTADSINLKDVVVDAGGFTVNDSVVIGGTLKVNDGKVVLDNASEKGTYQVGKITAAKAGSVEIKSGVIEANDLSTAIDSSSVAGGIVLNGGTISTLSGQVFTNSIDTTNEDTVIASSASGEIKNNIITFTSGTLQLNDSMYTKAYTKSAREALNNENVLLVMKGTEIDGKKVINVEELKEEIGEGNVKEEKVLEAAGSQGITINNEAIQSGGVGSVDLSKSEDKTVNIQNNQFTITGDANGNVAKDNGVANIVVGASENGNSTLNLGSEEATKTTNLNGSLTVNAGSTVNINNDTNVTGDINAVGAEGKETQVNVNGNGATNADKVNANNAKINVNGALHANQMALENANINSGLQAGAVVIKEGLTVAGETKIDGNVEAGTLTAQKDSKLNVTGNIKAGKLTAPKAEGSEVSNTVINIGDTDKASVASFENVELNGGMIFLDPIFKDGIKDASQLAVDSKENEVVALNGHYVVGQNSVITFGSSDNSKAVEIFERAAKANEMTWGKGTITAGAYLAKAINVEKGSLIVDGSIDGIEKQPPVPESANNGTVKFEANSILMINASAFGGEKVAITGANNEKVSIYQEKEDKASSKLIIVGAQNGETYKVFSSDIKTNWILDNVKADSAWVKFEQEEGETGFTAKYTSLAAQLGDAAPGANVIDAVKEASEINENKEFNKLNDVLTNISTTASPENVVAEEAKVVNNIIQATAQAGVASSAIVANAEVATAIGNHLGFASAAEVGGNGVRLNKENGSAVWAKLVHKKADVDGLKVGSIGKADYDVKQNGIVAGLDFVNTEDKAFGVAITYMDGKVTGAAAKNDTENYGLSVYGKKKVGKAAIIADLSYIHGENDIKAGTVTEKPKSDALSLGVKAETAIKAGAGQFVPYIGARVTRLGIGDYKDSLGIKHDSDVENLFNIPVGIKYSANIQKGNWTMRPTVDLGYVFNVGNKDGQETVSYGGASNTFTYEMVDKSSFVGALGFEMENKNVAYNLGYQYTKGDNTKAHKYMLCFKVKF